MAKPEGVILIVDDNPKNVQLIGSLLAKAAYKVSIAGSGLKALDIAILEPPDLILLDIMMPDMDGFETIRRLKTDRKTRDIPVIFLSALSDTVNKVEGFKLGAVDYVTKPVEPEELMARVKTHLALRALGRELEAVNAGLEETVEVRTRILRQKNLALQESEERFRTLVNNIQGAVYRSAFDINWTFSFISDRVEDISGYPASDFMDNQVRSYASIIHLDDRQMVEQQVLDAVSQNKPYELDYRIMHKDGSVRWVREKGEGIFDEDGNVACLDGVIYDHTLFKLVEDKLKQAQKMEIVGTLAGGLAHDFNNMLGGITGSISILEHKLSKQETIEREELSKHITAMREGASRAADMARQLLTMSAKNEKKVAPVDLNLAIKHVVKMCDSTFDRSVRLSTRFHAKPAMTSADPTQVEQILLNLCINGYHAMTLMREKERNKGGKLSIAVEYLRADRHFATYHPEARKGMNYWRVSVMDQGVGIDDASLSKIFHPFYTTKKDDMGTGLGLSIVHRLVKNHGGFMTVYSQFGIGSVFNVHLPANDQEPVSAQTIPRTKLPKGEGLVLIVDDEALMRESAKMMLKECGYNSIEAEDGEAGIRVYKERCSEIKLVLLDLVMPKKSGKECFAELKTVNPEVKVLLTSGFGQDEKVEAVIRMGVHGFLHKPYTLENLADALRDILKESGAPNS